MFIEKIKKHYLILAILLIASFIRFYGLTERGLVLWDSYLYANIAKTPVYVLEYIVKYWNDMSASGMIDFIKGNGCVFFGEKPGHTFLIFISFCIIGIKEWAVLVPMALCGIVSIYLVYLFCCRFISKEVGVLSAIILGFSGLQIGFSRTGFPQTDTMLMVILVLYFYSGYKTSRKINLLYICGVLLSFGTFFHHSYLIAILPIIVDFFIDYLINKNDRPKKSELLKLSAFVFFPLIIEEMIFYIASLLYEDIVPGSIMAFLLKKRMFEGAGKSASYIEGLRFYYNIISDVDGWIWVNLYIVAILASIYQFFKKKNSIIGILLGQILLPLAFWPWKYPTIKAITVSYPAISILVGYFIWNITKHIKFGTLLYKIFLIAIILSANYSFIHKQLCIKTGYKYILNHTKDIINDQGGYLRVEGQKNWEMILKLLMPMMQDDKHGLIIKNDDTAEYKIIDYRQMFSSPEYVDDIKKSGKLVYKRKIFEEFFPIYHYHRLKLKQYEYLKDNHNEEWLYVYLYKMN